MGGAFVRFAFVFLLLVGASVGPSSTAHADEYLHDGDIVIDPVAIAQEIANGITSVAKQVKENALYVEMTALWTSAKTLLSGSMDGAKTQDTTNAKVQLSGTQARLEASKRLTQAQVDAQTKNVLLTEQMRNKINPPPALPSDQFLCNVLLANQAPPLVVKYARMVSAIAQRGIDATYRGPWSNGNGPQFYADFEESHRSVANPIDGYDETVTDTDNMLGATDADLDSSIDALSRDYTYILPPVKLLDRTINGQTIKVMTFVPDKTRERDYAAQVRWIKASKYCYTLAGPRPSPPPINTRDTEAGKRKRAKYDSCRAKQNMFIKQCTDRLAVLTRPNCDMDEMKAFCDAAEDACAAAAEAHVDLDSAYNDCRNGLSLYEFETITNMMCGSVRRFQTEGFSRAPEDEKIRTLAVCGHLMSKWRERIQDEDEAFMLGVEGMRGIQKCYDSVQ